MTADNAVPVTGGAGYIGSHTCKALAAAGWLPVTIDDLSTGHADAVRWGPLIRGDCGDASLVVETMRAHGCRACVHFAAKAYVGESVHNPRKYYERNLQVSLRLLDALLDVGAATIVFSSTCATYGVPGHLPISERTPQAPINPYGETKLAIERAMAWYAGGHGLRWCALRYFNACGADPEGEIGERHDPEPHLIPLAIRAALGGASPLSVLGTDFPTPDGTAIRDYIHVCDLADAHVKALSAMLSSGMPNGAINLGTGAGISVREIVAAVSDCAGVPVPCRETGRRDGDPAALVADPSRAYEVLGWRAKYDIASAIRHAWAWHRIHG